jgi:hypothetical protein
MHVAAVRRSRSRKSRPKWDVYEATLLAPERVSRDKHPGPQRTRAGGSTAVWPRMDTTPPYVRMGPRTVTIPPKNLDHRHR